MAGHHICEIQGTDITAILKKIELWESLKEQIKELEGELNGVLGEVKIDHGLMIKAVMHCGDLVFEFHGPWKQGTKLSLDNMECIAAWMKIMGIKSDTYPGPAQTAPMGTAGMQTK